MAPLSGVQFSMAYEEQSDYARRRQPHKYHSVIARDSEGNVAGELHWRRNSRTGTPGQIDWVGVAPEHRRQGLATAMLEHARGLDLKPSPKHSPERTDDGDAWARSVGGRLPRRRD